MKATRCWGARWYLWLGLAGLLAVSGRPAAADEGVRLDYASGTEEHTGTDHGDAGHGGGGTNPLSVDPDLMIFTLIIFAVLLLVLRKFAWGPIAAALDAREESIAHQIAEAHRHQEQSRQLLAEHQAQLTRAAEEVKSMMEQARRDAEALRQKLVAEAEAAAQSERQRAVREIEASRQSALEDLARASVDQAIRLAGRIMSRQLSPEDHARLLQEALQRLPSDN